MPKQPKETDFPMAENGDHTFTLHLTSYDRTKRFDLGLPASEEALEAAKRRLEIEDFCEAKITGLDCSVPYIAEAIPLECISVEGSNALAYAVSEMWQTDGEVLTFLAALEVEQPSTFQEALKIAYNIDDYERITEGTYEYGQTVLRRIGADDEIIDTIDGYMDFERFGGAMMDEDGVRQTEFGLVRRLSEPFPAQQSGQIFQ